MSGQSWKLALVDLVRQQVTAGQTFRFQIVTGSMEPFLQPGDEVVVEPAAVADLRSGDIVMVGSGETFWVHRLEQVQFAADAIQVITRGDRNLAPDPAWAARQLVGRVQARIRTGRTLSLQAGRGYWICRTVGRLSRLECRVFGGLQPAVRLVAGGSERRMRLGAKIIRGPFHRLAGWISG